MPDWDDLVNLAKTLNTRLNSAAIKLVTAESCTGGLIAQIITAVPGASAAFDSGFVTYSNLSKTKSLGVSSESLEKNGAVSKEVAREMVRGALENSAAHLGVSVTGIAGPSGGTKDKPVGTVFIGYGRINDITVVERHLDGNRQEVRKETAREALSLLIGYLDENKKS